MTNLPTSRAPHTRREDILIHEAAHVVVAWELERTVAHVSFDHATWSGRAHVTFGVTSLAEDDTSDEAREIAEDDVIILHAGMAAQRKHNYEAAIHYTPRIDLDVVASILGRFEVDRALLLGWSTYLAERALAHVQQPDTWRRIEQFAAVLATRSQLTRRQLAALRRRLIPSAETGARRIPR